MRLFLLAQTLRLYSNLKQKGGRSSRGFESERPFTGPLGHRGAKAREMSHGEATGPHLRGPDQRVSPAGKLSSYDQECNRLRKGKLS